MKFPPSSAQYVSVLAVVGLLAMAFWLLITWGEHSPVGRLAFLVSMIVPANAFREIGSSYTPYLRGGLIRAVGIQGVLAIAVLMGLIGVIVLVKGLQAAYRIFVAIGLVFAP